MCSVVNNIMQNNNCCMASGPVVSCGTAANAGSVTLLADVESSTQTCFPVSYQRTHTHTPYNNPFWGLPVPGWAGMRKVKPIWILLKQETVNGSGISWAICKSAPRSWQITTPAPHHSVFYRPDALPAAQPTASKHWRMDGPAPPHVFLLLPVLRQNLWVGHDGKEL